MSLGKIHLVRHAEGLHNVFKDVSIHDPRLSDRGFYHAESFGVQFTEHHTNTVGAIITSPLRRAIQTSLTAYRRTLDRQYFTAGSPKLPGDRIEGAELVLNPDLQEVGDEPANTGSDKPTLQTWFPELDFSILPQNWPAKTGVWANDDDAVAKRMARVLQTLKTKLESLKGSRTPDIVVVTHGGIIAELASGLDMDLAASQSFVLDQTPNGKLSLKPATPVDTHKSV